MLHHLDRAVGGAVIDQDDFEGLLGLVAEGSEAKPQEFAAIPVDDYDGNGHWLL
jgi:hypothetical protein